MIIMMNYNCKKILSQWINLATNDYCDESIWQQIIVKDIPSWQQMIVMMNYDCNKWLLQWINLATNEYYNESIWQQMIITMNYPPRCEVKSLSCHSLSLTRQMVVQVVNIIKIVITIIVITVIIIFFFVYSFPWSSCWCCLVALAIITTMNIVILIFPHVPQKWGESTCTTSLPCCHGETDLTLTTKLLIRQSSSPLPPPPSSSSSS